MQFRQKKIRRSSEHRERLVEQDFMQNKAFANSPQPRRRKPAFVTRDNEASLYANSPTQSTPPPPLPFVISPSSPQPPPLHAPRAFRRLNEEPTNHRSRRAATAAKPGSNQLNIQGTQWPHPLKDSCEARAGATIIISELTCSKKNLKISYLLNKYFERI
jgi:hypothetical protein